VEEVIVTLVLIGAANPRGRVIVRELARMLGEQRVIPDRQAYYVCIDRPDDGRDDPHRTVRAALDTIAADWDEWLAMDHGSA
jgi:hypothetical protein